MKRRIAAALAIFLALGLAACSATQEPKVSPELTRQIAVTAQPTQEPENTPETEAQEINESERLDEEEECIMQMKIGNTVASVEWENNESVEALRELAADQPLTVEMSMYGGFEQVGSIDQSLPRNDVQTTTSAGDIVLYSGNQIVVFYGSNSWAYTRLGHITDKTAEELTALLGNGNVTITIGKGL